MNRTKIDWADYTINPVKGLCPMACSYCYARRMYKRFKWNPEIRYDRPLMYIEPFNIKTPSRIFVGSTMELFGDWIKKEWLEHIFEMVRYYKQHTFIFLTKQPQNLIKWSPFPPNCQIGVTLINNAQLLLAIGSLEKIEARVKFLSLEPLLNQLDALPFALKDGVVDWLIIGAQTPYSIETAPKKEWVDEIVLTADRERIPVFIKNNLKPLLGDYVRQEFPNRRLENENSRF